MIDLKAFCGADETLPYLKNPFSFGEHTFATDGRIMVRVPRLPDIPEIKKQAKWSAPLDGIETASFSVLSLNLPPEPPHGDECGECAGSGHQHSCPDCECPCSECGGTGYEQPEFRTSTTIRGVTYALRYVRMMMSLPCIEVMSHPRDGEPLLFRFDGGEGALMPMRGKMIEHVETEKAA